MSHADKKCGTLHDFACQSLGHISDRSSQLDTAYTEFCNGGAFVL